MKERIRISHYVGYRKVAVKEKYMKEGKR